KRILEIKRLNIILKNLIKYKKKMGDEIWN
ncbi:MAG: hypothetical protein C5S44_07680, partial [Candidatus Methanocomedens sp.]